MATELGKAYVQIMPSAVGMKQKIEGVLDKELSPAAEESGKKSGAHYNSEFGKTLKSGLAKAAKVGLAAVTAAAAGLAALSKQSVSLYSEYEQLAGGTELLFGDAYEKVMGYARTAYKDVQMSTNDYLTQVNGLSTGLKVALGGDASAAAELANRVVKAEADVVAATGASQESVQNAFNGIMKSNYTMLDNLQLGITPTKEGFQQVIDKVNEWNAANGNATKYQISNLADCQSALVDYIEMQGLANYAANEASDTIQGSAASMKAAWTDFLTGLSSADADLSTLTGNLMESVSALASNLVPVIQRMLPALVTGLTDLVNGLLPYIQPTLETLLPTLISGATSLVGNVAALLPGMITAALAMLPELASAALQIVGQLGQAIMSAVPQLTQAIVSAVPQLMQTAFTLIQGLADGLTANLPMLASAAIQIVTQLGQALMDAVPQLAQAAITLIQGLSAGLADNVPVLIQSGLTILTELSGSFHDNVGLIVDAAMDLALNLAQGLAASLPTIIEQVPIIVSNIANTINDNAPKILETGIQVVITLIGGLIQAIPTLVANIPKIISAIVDVITAFNWVNLGKNVIEFLGNGIKSMVSFVKGAGKNVLEGITGAIQSLPARLMEFGKNAVHGLGSAISGMAHSAVNAMKAVGTGVLNTVKGLPNQMLDIGKNLIKGLWNGISNMTGWIMNLIGGFAKSVISKIKGLFGIHSPSTVFAEIGGYLAEGLGVGWTDEYGAVERDLLSSVHATTDAVNTEVGNAVRDISGGVNADLSVQYSGGENGSLLAAINQLAELLKSLKIYLDTGVLVGELAPELDKLQGKTNVRRARQA